MKAVPSPSAASKASSHAKPRIAPTFPPRHAAFDMASRAAQHVGAAHTRGALAGTHVAHRAPHHTRRGSGSRPLTLRFDTKINKLNHRSKVGTWLENVHVDAGRPPASSPRAHPPPCPDADRMWKPASKAFSPETAQLIRNPDTPRMPLADITHLVLASESASNFWLSDTNVEPLPQRPSPCLAPDINGAIDLLTADEARELLLLSAQSNMSLASAIRGIALNRSSRSIAEVHHTELADTFRFDEDEMLSHV